MNFLIATPHEVLMLPKRGGDDGPPAKTLTSSTTKRVRRDETTTTQDASVMTPTASTAVASPTSHVDSPHASNAEDDHASMVDSNESFPCHQQWMIKKVSVCARDGSVDPITDAQNRSCRQLL